MRCFEVKCNRKFVDEATQKQTANRLVFLNRKRALKLLFCLQLALHRSLCFSIIDT